MKKTAMIELRDKLLEEMESLKDSAETSEHIQGYREAFKNITNDIDAQMKQMEIEQLKDAYSDGLNAHRTDFCNRDEYYAKTFGDASALTTKNKIYEK